MLCPMRYWPQVIINSLQTVNKEDKLMPLNPSKHNVNNNKISIQ